MDTFTRGTVRSITCTVTLNTPLPMDYNVTLDWMRDGSVFDNSTDRVSQSITVQSDSTYTSTITFSPLNTTDAGTYECIGTVDPIENNLLSNKNVNHS